MARAVLFTDPKESLEVVTFATPEPADEELLVRVTCCTLCRSDLHTHSGRRTEPTPTVLGHEIVGRIAAFGKLAARVDYRGTPAEIGSRITWAVAVGCGQCFFCANDLPQKCEHPYKYGHRRTDRTSPNGGGLADHIVLHPRTAWFVLPDALSDRIAAPANCATATAAAVIRYAGPLAGRSVLVLGAGVLGVTACAMAHEAGARVVMVSDPAVGNRERAKAFAAGMAFAADSEELAASVAQATQQHGADVVLELAGTAETARNALALARTGGVVVLAGTVAPTTPLTLDPENIVRRMLTIRGVHNYHPRDLEAALAFLAGPGQAYPFAELVGAEFPLEEVAAAFTHAHGHPGIRAAVIP